jgi:magnesium-transporting ATPase (P-type)
MCDEALPCDLLLLNSKSEDRKCYITTANLDGETNFKVRLLKNINIFKCFNIKYFYKVKSCS